MASNFRYATNCACKNNKKRKLVVKMRVLLLALLVVGTVAAEGARSEPTLTRGQNDCAQVGDRCADGTVLAGYSRGAKGLLFTTPNDAPSLLPWNAGDRRFSVDGAQSDRDGKLNSGMLNLSRRISAAYRAANYCASLTAHGHRDWYLPARDELNLLFDQRDKIRGFNEEVGVKYWSSSEYTPIFSWSQDFNTGLQDREVKSTALRVRCIRAEPWLDQGM